MVTTATIATATLIVAAPTAVVAMVVAMVAMAGQIIGMAIATVTFQESGKVPLGPTYPKVACGNHPLRAWWVKRLQFFSTSMDVSGR